MHATSKPRKKAPKTSKKKKQPTKADMMKWQIAREIGLADKVKARGWAGLSARETGRVGGLMTQRRKVSKEGV